jgi:hypothetical protein
MAGKYGVMASNKGIIIGFLSSGTFKIYYAICKHKKPVTGISLSVTSSKSPSCNMPSNMPDEPI